jgi:hypothetical protein
VWPCAREKNQNELQCHHHHHKVTSKAEKHRQIIPDVLRLNNGRVSCKTLTLSKREIVREIKG